MNDSENNKNNINKKPVTAIRRSIEDFECIVLGAFFGVILIIAGFTTLSSSIIGSLIILSISIFPICEIFRGVTSLNNKKMIELNDKSPNEEYIQAMKKNDLKIKKISKIKKYGFLLTIVLIVLAIVLGF